MPRIIFALHNNVLFCFLSCILSLMIEEKEACVSATIMKLLLLKWKRIAVTHVPTAQPGPDHKHPKILDCPEADKHPRI